jgi:hypothetical protein
MIVLILSEKINKLVQIISTFAMAKTKTAKIDKDPLDFINALKDETKRDDSMELVKLMSEITGEEPYMYGSSIVGFGNYHYKYASGHEGDAPLAGFSPRKDALTIYMASEFNGRDEMLAKLGKHKNSKGCIYVKKLEDIDRKVLKKIITASMKHTQKQFP